MKRKLVVILAIIILIAVIAAVIASMGNAENVAVRQQFAGVTLIEPTATPKTYGPPIPEVIKTPTPTVAPTAAPTQRPANTTVSATQVAQWWTPFIQERASLLYENVLGCCNDSQEHVATFAWVIQVKELNNLREGVDYEVLTQHVKYWDEYKLPQNGLGVLVVEKDSQPEGWRSKAAASVAPKDSVSLDGIIVDYRIGISADPLALKVVEFDYDPMVVVLRNPDPVTGQRYFLVIDHKVSAPVQVKPVGGQQVPSEDVVPDNGGGYVPPICEPTPNPVPTTRPNPTHAVDNNSKPGHAADGNSSTTNNGGTNTNPGHASDGGTSGGGNTNSDGHKPSTGAPSF